MTPQQQALEILLTHPLFARILGPHYKREHGGSIQWHALNYGVLSGGEKGAITWAYAIWCDVSPTSQGEQKYWRDPFDGFCTLDNGLQDIILRAFAFRHGWVNPLEKEDDT